MNAASGEEVHVGRCFSRRCGRRSTPHGRARGSSTRRSAERCGSPATTRRSRSFAAATADSFDPRSCGIRTGARSSSTRRRRTVRAPKGVELDLGATAKALAADRAANRAHAATGSGVLVSLGGDIAVAGAAAEGGWSVRIAEDNAAPLDVAGPVVGISPAGSRRRGQPCADGPAAPAGCTTSSILEPGAPRARTGAP